MKKLGCSLLACLLSLPAAARAADDDRAAVEAVVREFYTAYAAGDPAKVLSLWAPSSPDLPRAKRMIPDELRVKQIHVDSLQIAGVTVSGDAAQVDVVAQVRRVPRLRGRADDRAERRRVELARVDGRWRIVRMPAAEDDIIEKIIAAPSGDTAAAVAAEHAGEMSPAFVRAAWVRAFRLGLDRRTGIPDARLARIAAEVAERIGDETGRAAAIAVRAEADLRDPKGPDYDRLIRSVRDVLPVLEAKGDPDELARALNTLALLLLQIDLTSDEAEELLVRAVALHDSIEDSYLIYKAATILGEARLARQDYASAYRYYEDGLAAAIAGNLPGGQAALERIIGHLLELQNDPELAIAHYRRALELTEHVPTKVLALLGLARIYELFGDHAKAEESALNARSLADPTQQRLVGIASLVALGELKAARGDRAAARALVDEALSLSRTLKYEQGIVTALPPLGRILLDGKQYDEALKVSAELGEIAARNSSPGSEGYESLLLAARAHRALGDAEQAKAAYRGAIEHVESVRGTISGGDRELRLFIEPFSVMYTELADLLLEGGDAEGALLVAERGRARVLLESIGKERRDLAQLMSAGDRSAYEALVRELKDTNRKVVDARARGADKASIDALTQSQRSAQLAIEAFERRLSAIEPRIRAARAEVALVDPKRLDALVPRDDLALIEFVINDAQTIAFVVRHGRDGATLAHRRIAVSRVELERRVDDLVQRLGRRDLDYRTAARSLYDLLLAPLQDELRGARVYGIVPDGALWRLPFEALVAPDGTFLVERTACFYVPSLSVYREIVSKHQGASAAKQTLVAFGNPLVAAETRKGVVSAYRGADLGALPHAEEEVKAIARIYGARSSVFVRAEANEETAKREMVRARVVHFATHGLVDDQNPMFSQIVLSRSAGSGEDGVLQPWEIMRLDLAADLVVLSACETARGRFGAGEGMIGMSWALFVAGCPTAVASQWKIGSRSTSGLMIAFHRELKRLSGNGSPFAKAQALRAGQRALIGDRATHHPFFWAGFVLIGSGS